MGGGLEAFDFSKTHGLIAAMGGPELLSQSGLGTKIHSQNGSIRLDFAMFSRCKSVKPNT